MLSYGTRTEIFIFNYKCDMRIEYDIELIKKISDNINMSKYKSKNVFLFHLYKPLKIENTP